ncbi:hypothetical protein Tco_0853885 [Tanacetum coccineum]
MHNNIMAASPYVPSTVIIPAVPATDDSLEVPERTAVETLLNMSPIKNEHYQSTKEAIHLLLTRIGDKIYSTVDACKTAHDAYKTAHDMWIVRYQKEVNEICAKRIAKNAKPLALVIAAQQYPDPYYQEPKSHHNKTIIFLRISCIYPDTKILLNILRTQGADAEEPSTTQAERLQLEQFGILRTLNVDGIGEIVGSQVKDYTYHKEKMLLCKQAEKGVPIYKQSNADWLEDTDEEIDEQELEAHYNYMAKIQEVPTADSGTDSEPLEKTDQNVEECDDERVALANLIANLKLTIDENKKIRKKLKKVNASLTQELKEYKSTLEDTNSTPG